MKTKTALFGIAILLASSSASATVYGCRVANGDPTTRFIALCEALRVEVRARTSRWSNGRCATIFMERAMKQFNNSTERVAAIAEANARIFDARKDFDLDFPVTEPEFTPAPTATPTATPTPSPTP